jgi:hypothetical protein
MLHICIVAVTTVLDLPINSSARGLGPRTIVRWAPTLWESVATRLARPQPPPDSAADLTAVQLCVSAILINISMLHL